MLGKTEGKRRRGDRMRWLDGITYSMDINLSKFWETVKDREAWSVAAHDLVTEQQQNTLIDPLIFLVEVWWVYNIVLVSGV